MATENFEEHVLANANDVENVENIENLDNVENVENAENSENMENAENAENVENAENTENVENAENVDNVENDENVENVENAEYVPENSHPAEETQGTPENSNPAEGTQGTDTNSGHNEEKKWPGWPGENVFRMLVPVQKVGGIIGRKGEYIKKTCEETKARIKILDGPPGTTERTVMVSAKEEPDLALSPAMDGLLRVHNRIIDADSDSANVKSGSTICTRLLVAAAQAGSLIGKQGSTIKSIQDASNCVIRVLGGEHLPVFALPDDSVVEVQGEPAGVHKAIELIASQLRKFLVDRSVIGIFETQMQQPNARTPQNMPLSHSWGPQAFTTGSGGPGYEPNSVYMPPPRQFDNYYPSEMPPMDKLPRQGPSAYGRDPSVGAHTSNVQPQQSVVTKVTQSMQVPVSYADAVIGTSGSNISYIRRASGATIAIQETRGVPDEMTVEITGSASQVQTAQQLIQNFIADVANNVQNPAGGPPGEGYNPYSSHGPAYGSLASNAASHAPAGDYGSVYGSSYGY